MSDISRLIEGNRRWAAKRAGEDPEYFARHAEQQTPNYLWIGCSDSRLAPERITGLRAGELFVHRNVANLVRADDRNLMAVVYYAVDVLQVEHIIVCGHHRCGGVMAAADTETRSPIDDWLEPISKVADARREELDEYSGPQRLDRLCELSAIAQANALARTPVVQGAWDSGQNLAIHSWVYRLADGLIEELGRPRTGR